MRFADAPVVLHPPAVGVEEVDPLGTVHTAAAAEPDEQVRRDRSGRVHAGVDVAGGGVFVHVVEQRPLEPRRAKRFDPPRRVTCFADASIADDQRPTRSQFIGQRP